MKEQTKWILTAAAGVAVGAFFASRHREEKSEPVTAPEALLSPNVRRKLAEWIGQQLPSQPTVLVMSDDRGDLAHDLSPESRMIFSSDGDGAASPARPAWPENIIRAESDLQKLWLADDSLDAAVLVNVLQQYEDPAIALKELKRALKPDGLLLAPTSVRPDQISVSAWRSTMELLGVNAVHAWNAEELRAFLETEGWQITGQQTFADGVSLVCFACRSAAE